MLLELHQPPIYREVRERSRQDEHQHYRAREVLQEQDDEARHRAAQDFPNADLLPPLLGLSAG